MDARPLFHEPDNVRHDMRLGASLHYPRHDIAAAFDHAEHNCFVIAVSREVVATDECFVCLNRLAGTANRRVAVNVTHIEPDQMAHAPSGFVGDTQLALHFLGGHAVPRLAKQEHHIEPVPQAGAGLLKGRPCSRVDLIATMLALERAASPDPVIGRLFLALEAGKALAKPLAYQVGQAGVLIRKALLELADFGGLGSHDGLPPRRMKSLYQVLFYMCIGYILEWPLSIPPEGPF